MKRKTKVQVRNEGIAAIRNRLEDLLQGAYGGYSIYDDHTPFTLGSDTLGRFAGAVVKTWGLDQKDGSGNVKPLGHLCYVTSIECFDDLDGLADRLYDAGYRA